ncbi:MAG: TIGR02444 family protein [Alphaproteobacteria bacterium]|nr:TIGR02444 family protein [Alphaproteobacteria bacterium]
MTMPDREAKQAHDWPTAEDFWAFSIATYSHKPMEEACLDAQDSLKADVNLLLLCLWMDDHGIRPASDNWENLQNTAQWWQREKLGPLRMARRLLKGQDGYEDAKKAELAAEKQEQVALLACLTAPPKTSHNSREVWPCVSSYLHALGAAMKG